MKILITNNDLAARSGTSLYVKEVAEELTKRGHTVAAYSNSVGTVAEMMGRLGIQAVDNLSKLSWAPDVIHGQHHFEAMTALAHFPGVPAVYICHGWRPWQEVPPRHPRIIEYAAVDSATLEWAVRECGVPSEKIRLMHNFVDLDRFMERGPLPARPRRALVFSNYANNGRGNFLSLVRRACRKAGIPVDTVGRGTGNMTERPEDALKDYDIVFAVGRCALEALATGNAVIICGAMGVGPMVTLRDMDALRDKNFGVAAMYSKPDAAAIYREIGKYDAGDSGALTKKLRPLIGIEAAVSDLERFYSEVIEEYEKAAKDSEKEAQAFSSYLKNISCLFKENHSLLKRHERIISRLNSSIRIRLKVLFGKARVSRAKKENRGCL